jgi:hypothetical protein
VRPLVVLAVVYALVFGGLRATVAAPERCGDATAADAQAAALAGATWIARNQHTDGSYLYLYSRTRGVVPEYNSVRHAGATLALYNAASLDQQRRASIERDERVRLLQAGDRGLQWMLEHLEQQRDFVALPDGAWAPLGGDALMLAALAERRLVTHDTTYDDTMRALGRFVLASQRPDGGFYVAYDLGAGDFVREGTSPYYPGEATWALARLSNAFPDELPWRRAARRGADFIALHRDDVEHIDYPPLNDHWGAYAFAEMARWPITDAQAHYARLLYGRFWLLLRSQAQRDNNGLYAATHSLYRRGAAVGTWVEGLAALARLAHIDPRVASRRGAIDDAVHCGAGVLVRRQSHDRRDGRVDGAWYAHDETRVDDQQHPVSALVAVVALAKGR